MKSLLQLTLVGLIPGMVYSQIEAMTYVVNRAMFNTGCWAQSLAIDGHSRFQDARTEPLCTGYPCNRRVTLKFETEVILGLDEIYMKDYTCHPAGSNNTSLTCLIRIDTVSLGGTVSFDSPQFRNDRFKAFVRVKNDSYYNIAAILQEDRRLLLTEASVPQLWFDVEEVVRQLRFDEYTKDQFRRSLSDSLTRRMREFMYFYKLRLDNEFRFLLVRNDRQHKEGDSATHSEEMRGKLGRRDYSAATENPIEASGTSPLYERKPSPVNQSTALPVPLQSSTTSAVPSASISSSTSRHTTSADPESSTAPSQQGPSSASPPTLQSNGGRQTSDRVQDKKQNIEGSAATKNDINVGESSTLASLARSESSLEESQQLGAGRRDGKYPKPSLKESPKKKP